MAAQLRRNFSTSEYWVSYFKGYLLLYTPFLRDLFDILDVLLRFRGLLSPGLCYGLNKALGYLEALVLLSLGLDKKGYYCFFIIFSFLTVLRVTGAVAGPVPERLVCCSFCFKL